MMQQLYVNCYDQQQQAMMPLPQFSPFLSFYRAAPVPQPTLPIFISPGSSGRFDAGYDSSSGASPTEFAGFAMQQPVIYSQQASPYLPPPPPVTAAVASSPMSLQPPPQSPHLVASEPAVWRDKFLENFSRFPIGLWQLTAVTEPPDVHNSKYARHLWRYHLEKAAKVNFVCTACHNSTSATGQAVFWIYKDDFTNTGHIHMKLYGHKCPRCQSPAEAMWHPQDAESALDGLYDHVAQVYYGVQAPATPPRSRNHRRDRQHDQRQSHPQEQQTRMHR